MLGQLGCFRLVVARDGGDQGTVGGVHLREQLGLGVHHHDGVDGSEGLLVHQPGRAGRGQQRGGRGVGGGVLPVEETTGGERSPVQRHSAVGQRGLDPLAELGGLGRGDQRPELQHGKRIGGLRAVDLDRQRVTEAQARHHRQVGGEERVDELSLDDEARVGGAALLAVLEAFAHLRGQAVPVGELPHPVGVEPFLLEHVALAGVDELRRDGPTVGAAPDEGQRPQRLRAHQGVGELTAIAGDQGDGQTGVVHEGVHHAQAHRPALRGGFGDDGVAREQLDQLGVDEHAHRVVPGGDVGHRTRQRGAPVGQG